jgi:hypothetical protein
MIPETVILSPLDHPVVWLAFILKWGGSALGVVFAFRLWRSTSTLWWMLICAAFLLSIVSYIVQSALEGTLPLPLGIIEPGGPLQTRTEFSATSTYTITMQYEWDIVAPIIAAALWCAWNARKRTVVPKPIVAPDDDRSTRLDNSGASPSAQKTNRASSAAGPRC